MIDCRGGLSRLSLKSRPSLSEFGVQRSLVRLLNSPFRTGYRRRVVDNCMLEDGLLNVAQAPGHFLTLPTLLIYAVLAHQA